MLPAVGSAEIPAVRHWYEKPGGWFREGHSFYLKIRVLKRVFAKIIKVQGVPRLTLIVKSTVPKFNLGTSYFAKLSLATYLLIF